MGARDPSGLEDERAWYHGSVEPGGTQSTKAIRLWLGDAGRNLLEDLRILILSIRMRNLLKNLELYTLLALARGPLHGYGLATQIEVDSDRQLKPLPGNLYVVLKRLQQGGLVRPVEPETQGSAPAAQAIQDVKKRRTYELTDLGRRRLAEESQRMATFAQTVELRFSPGDEQG